MGSKNPNVIISAEKRVSKPSVVRTILIKQNNGIPVRIIKIEENKNLKILFFLNNIKAVKTCKNRKIALPLDNSSSNTENIKDVSIKR